MLFSFILHIQIDSTVPKQLDGFRDLPSLSVDLGQVDDSVLCQWSERACRVAGDDPAIEGTRRSDEATLIVAGGRGGRYVTTPHLLASRAALQIMERGGNAIDGAIAANAVQGVVAPNTCGIGGDLFALIHRPGDSAPAVFRSAAGTYQW